MEIGTASTGTGADEKAGLSYQDVRDDRVLSYFELAAAETKTIRIRLNAAFLGEFYFPALSSEAMYRPEIRARTAGLPVSILKTLAEGANRPVAEEPETSEVESGETTGAVVD